MSYYGDGLGEYDVRLSAAPGGRNHTVRISAGSTQEAREIAEQQYPGCKAEAVHTIRNAGSRDSCGR
jgi:hypothetical protein